MIALLPLLLLGCRPDAVELDPDAAPPTIATDALPDGRTHEAYTAWLDADGGAAPLTWSATELPAGLALNPAGAITGMPVEKGTTAVALTVVDDRGRSDEVTLPLQIRWAEGSVGCERERNGELDEVASLGWNEVDWEAEGGWTLVEIPLPDPEITTLSIEVDAPFADLYLAMPGTPEGSTDPYHYASRFAVPGVPLVVDLGTWPDLESYRAYGEPIQLLLAASLPGPWSVSVSCLDIPVVVSTSTSPVQVGEPLSVNYSIHGEQASVTWDLVGELPSWASFDPESGRISGVAQELGTWSYTLEVTDVADGASTSVVSGFGVYEPVPVACDQTEVWTPHGYWSGEVRGASDPDGYRVFELPLDRSVSGVTAWFDTEGGEVGFAAPDGEPWDLEVAGDWDWLPSLLSSELSVSSWPPIGAYDDVLYAVARPDDDGPAGSATFWFECDPLPRPELPALPVLEVGLDEAHALSAIGGAPPYTWAAQGLPAEVSLSVDGVLSTTAPPAGTWDLDVRVVDSLGAETSTPLTLYAGAVDACQGHPVLACGETHADTLGANVPTTVCLPPSVADTDIVVLTADPISASTLDVFSANPGGEPGAWDRYLIAARSYEADATVFDDTRDPPLSAWTDLPRFVDVSSASGGSFELRLDCY